jgi:hypothetical protein
MAEDVLRRLKFSRADREAILFAVKHHMVMHKFGEMRLHKRRALAECEHFPLLVTVSRADTLSTGRDTVGLDAEVAEVRAMGFPAPLINGDMLIAAGVPEGPRIGRMLQKVREMQLGGSVSTVEEAMRRANTVL